MGTGAGSGDPRFGRRDDSVVRGGTERPDSGLAPVTYLRSADGGARVDRRTPSDREADETAELDYVPEADGPEETEWADAGAAGQACDDLYSAGQRAETSAAGWTVPGLDYAEVRERAERAGGRRGNHPAGSRMLQQGADDDGSSADAVVGSGGSESAGKATSTGTGSAARKERRAENVSMAALKRRGMSRWEIEKTLTSRELEPDVIAAEIARLESVGLIDDAELADTIVRTQHDRKGLGRSALIAELRRRHIDQEHIDAALEQVDDDDELQTALGLAERRARQLTSLDRETAARRLTGYLMRKGYGSQIVRTAVDEALAGHRGSKPGGVRFR